MAAQRDSRDFNVILPVREWKISLTTRTIPMTRRAVRRFFLSYGSSRTARDSRVLSADWSPVCGDQLALYNELRDEFAKRKATCIGMLACGYCELFCREEGDLNAT